MAIEEVSNKTNQTDEGFLHFDHLNFKLAIVQVLMNEEELLKPTFDIYDLQKSLASWILIPLAWISSNQL